MPKKQLVLSATIMMTLSLAACGTNEEGNQGGQALPIGYYSNEDHEEKGGHTNWLNEDNDGPFTEIMDHSFGGEGERNQLRALNNDAAPGGEYNDTLFSRDDRNYHGHLNENRGGARSPYFTGYDGARVKKINEAAALVVNVADARSIIHEEHLLIGVMLEDPSREQETKAKIKDVVEPFVEGKKLTIVTNDSMYSEIKTIDNDLREGGSKDVLDRYIKGLFSTLDNVR